MEDGGLVGAGRFWKEECVPAQLPWGQSSVNKGKAEGKQSAPYKEAWGELSLC